MGSTLGVTLWRPPCLAHRCELSRAAAAAVVTVVPRRYYELVDEIEEERMFMAGKLNKKDLEVVDKTSHGGRCVSLHQCAALPSCWGGATHKLHAPAHCTPPSAAAHRFDMKKFGGQTLRIRVWQNDGKFHGRPHAAGDRMYTWEVMAEHGIFSYDIVANKRYRVRRATALPCTRWAPAAS